MFLKLLVSLLSIIILVKNFSYAIYEYKTNSNTIGSISVIIVSFITVLIFNIVLFIIKF